MSSEDEDVIDAAGMDLDDSSDEDDQLDSQFPVAPGQVDAEGKAIAEGATKVDNQQHDEEIVIDSNDDDEVASEDDDNEFPIGEDDEPQPEAAEADMAPPPVGGYNPADYAGLNIDSDIQEYISRYQPKNIELESPLRPFIPDYIPAVGEVDAFLKMPKPSGEAENLGIMNLDEPNMNCSDSAVLVMKYIQSKKTDGSSNQKIDITSIEMAESNQKEIQKWISSIEDLHKGRPMPSVAYTKAMPDFDTVMDEWPSQMEHAMKNFEFPGPDIAMSTEEYARLMCAMLNIPVHKTANNKGVIEALHMMFTVFSDFKENPHFQKQEQQV